MVAREKSCKADMRSCAGSYREKTGPSNENWVRVSVKTEHRMELVKSLLLWRGIMRNQ